MFGTETAVNFYKFHLKVKSQQAMITISRFYIISSECHVSSFRGTAVSEIGKMLFAFFFLSESNKYIVEPFAQVNHNTQLL